MTSKTSKKALQSAPALRLWLLRFTLLGLCLVLLPWVSRLYNPMLPDFIEYWTAGRLNLEGQNPYGRQELLSLQLPLGWDEPEPLRMWNPPWTLPLVMPFGLLEYGFSRLIWYFLQVGLIIYCADRFWKVYGGPARWRWIGWGTALLSSYTIYVLVFGQISPFILLGMVWFVLWIERPPQQEGPEPAWLTPKASDFLAGAAAFLISIKPQAFYLFYPMLLVWVFSARRFWVLAGLGSALLLALLISAAFNPQALGQYLQALGQYPPENWATPTLGYWARRFLGLDRFWLQFPFVLIGLGWMFWYGWKRRTVWRWSRELPLLAAVSLVTTAYAWTHDQILLIPAGLQILAGLFARLGCWRPVEWVWAGGWIGFHLATIPLHFGRSDEEFVWQAPAILAWYLLGLWLTFTPEERGAA